LRLAGKGSKTVAGEIFGTDGQHKQTQELLCPEYILQSEHVVYRIRPKDDKHPMLLPIGETAQFRISKDKLILRVPELNDKEHEYVVVSMIPRELVRSADTTQKTASLRVREQELVPAAVFSNCSLAKARRPRPCSCSLSPGLEFRTGPA
jgi:hypothetical protein